VRLPIHHKQTTHEHVYLVVIINVIIKKNNILAYFLELLLRV